MPALAQPFLFTLSQPASARPLQEPMRNYEQDERMRKPFSLHFLFFFSLSFFSCFFPPSPIFESGFRKSLCLERPRSQYPHQPTTSSVLLVCQAIRHFCHWGRRYGHFKKPGFLFEGRLFFHRCSVQNCPFLWTTRPESTATSST
jgi:hypothetical protein